MSNEALRRSMSVAAQGNVQRFGMQQIAERWRAVFENNE
jgi:hypothetical protein